MSRLSLQWQLASLAVLWCGLLSIHEAQPLVLISLPVLIGLRVWRPKALDMRRRVVSNGMVLALLTAWVAGAELNDRGAWLAAFSNLLWLLCGLKTLELDQYGAQRRTGLLLVLAAGTSGLFAQALGPSLLQAAAACMAIASLIVLEMTEAGGKEQFRSLCLLVGLSLPLVVVLFVLAPRLSPVWLIQGGTSTGLSAELDPGSIASLVKSEAPAMRIQFDGISPPEPAERYWRVMTLNQFDGRRWSANADEPRQAAPTPASAANIKPQINILLEQSNLRWLPWWGTGLPWPSSIRRTADGGIVQNTPVRGRTLYKLSAASWNEHQPWRFVEPTAADLQIPTASNPRLVRLGRQWLELPDTESKILTAKSWFLKQGFRYTLEPGKLPANDALDTFLFENRRGFCEHFAAAFSALMRASNVPSRIVVGYQGGKWVHAIGAGAGHLQVQQSDAHAWSEVWIEGRGWTRVDPTAWIVPSRTEESLFESLEKAGSTGDQKLLSQSRSWMRLISGQWQVMDLKWNLWVMQFDQARQEDLLSKWFGSYANRWQTPLLIVFLSTMIGLGLMTLQWLQAPKINRERHQLNQCLKRLGLVLQTGETLEAAVARLGQQRPELTVPLQNLSNTYNQMRFGAPSQQPNLQQWKKCLKSLGCKRSIFYIMN